MRVHLSANRIEEKTGEEGLLHQAEVVEKALPGSHGDGMKHTTPPAWCRPNDSTGVHQWDMDEDPTQVLDTFGLDRNGTRFHTTELELKRDRTDQTSQAEENRFSTASKNQYKHLIMPIIYLQAHNWKEMTLI